MGKRRGNSKSNNKNVMKLLGATMVTVPAVALVSGVASADTTAAILNSATVNGNQLVLTYSGTLDATSVPDAADYTVKNGANTISVSNVEIKGSSVTLTLGTAVANGDTVTVSYTPGSNPVKDSNGNQVDGFTDQAVNNQTPEAAATPINDLKATSGDQQVHLTFSAPTGATKVEIQQSTDGTNWTPATIQETLDETSTSATVTELNNGTQYSFRVVVTGGVHEGISNVVTATPTVMTIISGKINGQLVGAEVVVSDNKGNLISHGTIDSSGNYTIEVPPGIYNVTAALIWADNQIDISQDNIDATQSIQNIDFWLGTNADENHGAIQGMLTYSDGSPASNIRILFKNSTNSNTYYGAVTNNNGKYIIGYLPPGDYSLVKVTDIHWNPLQVVSAPQTISITANNKTTQDLQIAIPLQAPSSLKVNGTTVSWDAVQNASGYSVTIYDSTNRAVKTIDVTDTSIDLSLQRLSTGDYTVTVIAKGNGNTYSDSQPSSASGSVSITAESSSNKAPVANSNLSQALTVGDTPKTLSASELATDSDGDTLTLSNPSTEDSKVATVELDENGNLVITPVGAGSTNVTVKVDDGNNHEITVTIPVTVNAQNSFGKIAAIATDATVAMDTDNKAVSSSDNTFVIHNTNGTLKDAISKDDVAVTGLPSGLDYEISKTAQGDIQITITGTADQALTADVPLTVVVKSSAVTDAGAQDSDPINVTLKHVKPFTISSSGKLDRTSGIKASVTVVPTSSPMTTNQFVVFQLMKGTEPVEIVALEKNIQSPENLIGYFNVADKDDPSYSVKVFVFDQFNTDTNSVQDNLADPQTLE